MSDIAIRVENLSKRYRIGGPQASYKTLRESLVGAVTGSLHRLRHNTQYVTRDTDTIWALKDISFEVKRGEVVGIIGRNGAGKSTLLKILSRITEPTEGYAEIYGRVGSLLEVGTGFHPELTGRENIYLNGAILGMKKAEIDRRFDEIVAFAEIEKFIDTPVKHYSSGMGLRLGFAVAAHLEPEILVVDEVLAVGDAQFQKKCLGKMSEVAGEGRTVLFVSHNMAAVNQLCTEAMMLKDGQVWRSGPVQGVIDGYLQENQSQVSYERELATVERGASQCPLLLERILLFKEQRPTSQFETFGEFNLEVTCLLSPDVLQKASLGFVVTDALGDRQFVSHSNQYCDYYVREANKVIFHAAIEQLPLLPGRYKISLYLSDGIRDIDVVRDAIAFEVVWNPRIPIRYPPRTNWGKVYVPVAWCARRDRE